MASSTLLVTTIATCFTEVEGSVGEEHRVFPTNWLMIVAVTAAILCAGILLSYRVHKRVLKVVTLRVLEKFEQWCFISFAMWFCTILAFACGDLFGGVQTKGWEFAMYIIPTCIGCYFTKGCVDKMFLAMMQAFQHEQRGHSPTSCR